MSVRRRINETIKRYEGEKWVKEYVKVGISNTWKILK